jgi:alkanesulfonate monooxygenase SsuD/methylene tetrahydromethanopterin reductase-like flavin-dependent oxidoreductase (luciferase family)
MTDFGYTMMCEQSRPDQSARLWDLPDQPVPIGIAVSGPDSCRLAGQKADIMIAVEPQAEFIDWAQAELLPALRAL